MKHLAGLTTSVLTLVAAFAGPALADGIPRGPVLVAPPPPPDRCGYGPWTGFYAGGNLGWSGFDHSMHDRNGFFGTPRDALDTFDKFNFLEGEFNGAFPFRHEQDDTSFTGGGQIGYNFQCQGIVFGVEADLNWADHGRTRHSPINDRGFDVDGFDKEYFDEDNFFGRPHFLRHRSNHDWFGTVRGRLGWASDRIMVYATAGGAFGNPEHNLDGIDFFGFHHRSNDNNTSWGWTAGGGVEFLADSSWTVKLEGLWIGWEDRDSRLFRPEVSEKMWIDGKEEELVFDRARQGRFEFDHDQWVFRVGVNYLFNRQPPPVVPLK